MWGGELMIADFVSFRRVGHLRPAPMPGGVNAIREPWRMGAVWAAARQADGRRRRPAPRLRRRPGEIARLFAGVGEPTVGAVLDLAGRATTPVTTSVGRLFDAVAALLGCRTHVSYEAQAAIELEAMARTIEPVGRYPLAYAGTVARRGQLDPCAVDRAIAGGSRSEAFAVPIVAAGFHEALGRSATEAAVAAGGRSTPSTRSSSPAACSRTSGCRRSWRTVSIERGSACYVTPRFPPTTAGSASVRPRSRRSPDEGAA